MVAHSDQGGDGYGHGIKESLATAAMHESSEPRRLPHIDHATSSKPVKGEDIIWVQPYKSSDYALFMVCDGHSGSEAASFATSHFHRILSSRVPKKLPDFDDDIAVRDYAEQLRKAVTETFVKIDNDWARLGQLEGTTVTVALITGWILTVANAGDSLAVLDTPKGVMDMVCTHRINDNLDEQERLRGAGAQIAPLGFHLQGPAKPDELGVGPLRLWPGGLCVSRSVGDLDAGPLVLPVPHIKQVVIPPSGARIILATDGLWDVISPGKAARLTRSKEPQQACSALISAAARDRRLADDMSIVIVDVLPHGDTTYPALAHPQGHHANGATPSGSGGFFSSCFKGGGSSRRSQAGSTVSELPTVELLADVDCFKLYPNLYQALTRSSLKVSQVPTHRSGDYTMHGPTEARVFRIESERRPRQAGPIPEEKTPVSTPTASEARPSLDTAANNRTAGGGDVSGPHGAPVRTNGPNGASK